MGIETKYYTNANEPKSLGLASATVGQIAKITAVDASGKPIAWGPADMPSGEDSDFVVNASLDDNNNCTVDKTYTQIQEAVQAGKKPVVHFAQDNATITMPLTYASNGAFAFAAILGIMETVSQLTTISVQSTNEIVFMATYLPGLDPSNGTFNQVEMNEDPKMDMEIATKKYVDDALAAIVDGTEVSY